MFSRAATLVLPLGIAMAMTACGNEPAKAPSAPLAETPLRVRSSAHGITLAVGDTFRLSVVASNLDLQSIAVTASEYRYTSDDTTTVRVSPTGLLTGVQPTALFTPVHVVVSLSRNNALVTDTLYVAVTPTRQSIASIKILPTTDSTRVGIPAFTFFNVSAYDSLGIPVFGVYVWPHADDPSLFIDPFFYYILGFAPGRHWIYVEATAYGTTYRDSLAMDLINPASADFLIALTPSGSIAVNNQPDGLTYYLQPCGAGTWTNSTSDTVDVVFDDPSKTGVCAPGDSTGNAPRLLPGTATTRKFPAAGDINWHLARSRAPNVSVSRGTISVK